MLRFANIIWLFVWFGYSRDWVKSYPRFENMYTKSEEHGVATRPTSSVKIYLTSPANPNKRQIYPVAQRNPSSGWNLSPNGHGENTE